MGLIGTVIGILIGAVFSGLIILFIGRRGWGIEVDSYRPAYLTAVYIAVLAGVVHFIWGLFNFEVPAGLSGAVINAVTTAILLQFVGDRLEGLRVKGYSGALLAAVLIGLVAYLIGWLVPLAV